MSVILSMSSKTLDRIYMANEKKSIVLNSSYVIISTKIRIKNSKAYPNIKCFNNALYPTNEVAERSLDNDIYRDNYIKQLSQPQCLLTIANLVKFAYDSDYPMIILASPTEYNKCLYIKILGKFIEAKFGYPVINYKKNPDVLHTMEDYKSKDCYEKVKKIIKKCRKKVHEEHLKTSDGQAIIRHMASNASKKKLKKILDKRGLYKDGLSKEEMVDRYKTFCMDDII